MKKNEKRKLWKQGLGTALVCGLAVAVFPAAKADAADLLKAKLRLRQMEITIHLQDRNRVQPAAMDL